MIKKLEIRDEDHDWFTHMVQLLGVQGHPDPIAEAAKREAIQPIVSKDLSKTIRNKKRL